MRVTSLALLVLSYTGLLPNAVGAQPGHASSHRVTIVGCLVDSTRRIPLGGLDVSSFAASISGTTDSAGFLRFRIPLPLGPTTLAVFPRTYGSRRVVRSDVPMVVTAETLIVLGEVPLRTTVADDRRDSLKPEVSEQSTRWETLRADCHVALEVAAGKRAAPTALPSALPDIEFNTLLRSLLTDSLVVAGASAPRHLIPVDSLSRRLLAAARVTIGTAAAAQASCPYNTSASGARGQSPAGWRLDVALSVTRDRGGWLLRVEQSCTVFEAGHAREPEGSVAQTEWEIRRIGQRWQVVRRAREALIGVLHFGAPWQALLVTNAEDSGSVRSRALFVR